MSAEPLLARVGEGSDLRSDPSSRRLRTAADPEGLDERVDDSTVDTLVADLAVAARVEPVATAVGASYRYRACGRVGWPPLRWRGRSPVRRASAASW